MLHRLAWLEPENRLSGSPKPGEFHPPGHSRVKKDGKKQKSEKGEVNGENQSCNLFPKELIIYFCFGSMFLLRYQLHVGGLIVAARI
jgi:hypothetical protein